MITIKRVSDIDCIAVRTLRDRLDRFNIPIDKSNGRCFALSDSAYKQYKDMCKKRHVRYRGSMKKMRTVRAVIDDTPSCSVTSFRKKKDSLIKRGVVIDTGVRLYVHNESVFIKQCRAPFSVGKFIKVYGLERRYCYMFFKDNKHILEKKNWIHIHNEYTFDIIDTHGCLSLYKKYKKEKLCR